MCIRDRYADVDKKDKNQWYTAEHLLIHSNLTEELRHLPIKTYTIQYLIPVILLLQPISELNAQDFHLQLYKLSEKWLCYIQNTSKHCNLVNHKMLNQNHKINALIDKFWNNNRCTLVSLVLNHVTSEINSYARQLLHN